MILTIDIVIHISIFIVNVMSLCFSHCSEWVNKTLKGCDKIRNIEEETIPVLYPRVPGVPPPKKGNKNNAWYVLSEPLCA